MKIDVKDLGIDETTGEAILGLEFDNEAFEKLNNICKEYKVTIQELCVKYLEWVVNNKEEATKTISEWAKEEL